MCEHYIDRCLSYLVSCENSETAAILQSDVYLTILYVMLKMFPINLDTPKYIAQKL
jgi:hypothetical protein